MRGKLEIYKVNLNNISEFSKLIKLMWIEVKKSGNLMGWTGATDEIIDELSDINTLKDIILKNKIFMAKIKDELVGFAALRQLDDEEGELAGIVIRESYTGRGIGSSLFNIILNEARKMGLRRLIVKTEKENLRALSFYSKMGFKPIKEDYEEVHGIDVRIVILSLEIER